MNKKKNGNLFHELEDSRFRQHIETTLNGTIERQMY